MLFRRTSGTNKYFYIWIKSCTLYKIPKLIPAISKFGAFQSSYLRLVIITMFIINHFNTVYSSAHMQSHRRASSFRHFLKLWMHNRIMYTQEQYSADQMYEASYTPAMVGWLFNLLFSVDASWLKKTQNPAWTVSLNKNTIFLFIFR